MADITIDILRGLCKDETISMPQHAYNRCRERSIKYANLKAAILSGEIIEQYPNDYPHPSCLTLGAALNGHIYIWCAAPERDGCG